MANNVQRLARLGQSIWLDNIERKLFASGELERLVADGLLGMTSNPTIFEKAIAASADYDDSVTRLARRGAGGEEICEAIFLEDVGAAADRFRSVYDRSQGGDGFVSIEVSPRLARDGAATLAAARRLWQKLARPNVMVKIPATREGLPAIEAALAEGININVTLMFSMRHYESVVEAYLRGLERRLEAGGALGSITSVASFFVSRVDVLVDGKLPTGSPLAGKAAIANSKLVYERYGQLFGGERFARLAAHGARRQRVLWASTSTKNPAYPDTIYVDTLIGPDTVNTVPPQTWHAILDHARVERTVDAGLDESRRVRDALAGLGLDLDVLGEQLSDEGVAKFAESYDALLAAIEGKRRKLAG